MAADKPVSLPRLAASPEVVKIGTKFTLSGSGYPINITLQVRGGFELNGYDYGTVKTNAAGKFTKEITVDTSPWYKPGPYTFFVSTEEGKIKTKFTLTLAED